MATVELRSDVNGGRKEGYRICSRCVMDTTVREIRFDASGTCNFCGLHDRLEARYPLDAGGEQNLSKLIESVKRRTRRRRYDCAIGISGGRDSTYTLYLAAKRWGLRVLAVHFDDHFGNPVAAENMRRATEKLGVGFKIVTSDWNESRDLKIAFLKASTPDMEAGTDIGIATALYGTAVEEDIKTIFIGHSFRTEGIIPLSWNYMEGDYTRAVHRRFGTVPLKRWRPADPGFNLGLAHLFYYAVIKGIRVFPVCYYFRYVRSEADAVLQNELGWVNTGAHYYDDLYQGLMHYIYRVKFGMERRRPAYSALVRSGQMPREEALRRLSRIYAIEDPKVMDYCIERLGLSKQEFEEIMRLPARTFRDYPNRYRRLRNLRPLVKLLSRLNLIPGSAYDKYFHCGL